MSRVDIFIEHTPEHYHGADVSITISAKPSARYLAEYLRQLILSDSDEEGKNND